MDRNWWGAALTVVVLLGCTTGSSSVRSAEQVRATHRSDAEVFMKTAATASQTAAVRNAIRRSHLVRKFAFLSRDDAYREFRRLFRDHPDLTAAIDRDLLPASFRLELVHGAKRGPLGRALQRLPGVDQVKIVATAAEREKILRKLSQQPRTPRP